MKQLRIANAIFIEINDPAFHLEYFKKCAELGKPVFLDKPLADNIQHGAEIIHIAQEKNIKMFSSSSLRHVKELVNTCDEMPVPLYTTVYGSLDIAPAGSSIIWYGVHAFEMLQKAMGGGALCVTTNSSESGIVAIVEYADGRRGVVELTIGSGIYGGCLKDNSSAVSYVVDTTKAYTTELYAIRNFLRGGTIPVSFEDTLEVMGLLDTAERSYKSGKTEAVFTK